MQSQICRNVLRMKTVNYQNVNFYSVMSANRYSNQDFRHEPNLHRKEIPKNSIYLTNLFTHDGSRMNNLLQHRSLSISAIRFSEAVTASSIAASETGSTASAEAVTAVSTSADSNELLLDFLPEKPLPIDPTAIIGEPSFESLGLGSWWPSGQLQSLMEWLHVSMGLEWFQAIALTALCLRLMSFPLVVMSQRNIAKMTIYTPEMQALQDKVSEARKRGDMLEMTRHSIELQDFMKKNKINPIKNVLPGLVQMPIFISMFFGLRKMANLPVPSMETGGALWFENLTMMDPFYLLPVMTSCSLFLQFRIGADGQSFKTMGNTQRIFMMGLPFFILPFTFNFPSAVTWYWFCTNTIAIVQASVLKTPALRTKFGIPKMRIPDVKQAKSKKSFMESVKDSVENIRSMGDVIDKRAADEQAFLEAGRAKPRKTYKYDPNKPIALKNKKY